MLFNSFTFLLFFAIVVALYSLPVAWTHRKLVLLIASYLFYAAWNPPFVALLWLSTVVDWFAARLMERSERRGVRRGLLGVSLLVNLGLLGLFKYGNFACEAFVDAAALVGLHFVPPELDLILPVGISFYTFQTLSYSIDVYRRVAKPCNSFLDFALYVTFFPQLVAGPIVRATDFLPQARLPQRANLGQFVWGVNLLLLGIFQKAVVADGLLAPTTERIYAAEVISTAGAWLGTLAFAGQIFCDFAGYSTAAIGVALCLGFRLPDNFRFPYAAIGFSDFWRRWHISLSAWLRDYLYIPLGGNRRGPLRTHANLMLTMLLGGLWHGAAWTFVLWGAMHGLLLILERWLRTTAVGRCSLWRTRFGRFTLAALTFAAVCVTWTVFRAHSFTQAASLVVAMFGLPSVSELETPAVLPGAWETLVVVSVMATLLTLHGLLRNTTLEAAVSKLPWAAVAIVNAAMIYLLATMPGEDRAFIYFQF